MVALTCCKSSGTPAEAMPLNATRKIKLRLSTKLRHFITATPRVKRKHDNLSHKSVVQWQVFCISYDISTST